MPISFKREGGEIPVERDSLPIEHEKIDKFLYVFVKCVTDKGNCIDFVFDGAKNNVSTIEQISKHSKPIEVSSVSVPDGTHAQAGKFGANLNFEFDTLLWRYWKEDPCL